MPMFETPPPNYLPSFLFFLVTEPYLSKSPLTTIRLCTMLYARYRLMQISPRPKTHLLNRTTCSVSNHAVHFLPACTSTAPNGPYVPVAVLAKTVHVYGSQHLLYRTPLTSALTYISALPGYYGSGKGWEILHPWSSPYARYMYSIDIDAAQASLSLEISLPRSEFACTCEPPAHLEQKYVASMMCT